MGVHAFSTDGLNWTMSTSITYNTSVRFADGSLLTYKRRERPHVLVRDGVPTHLYNGVLESGQKSGKKDRSYTLVAKLSI